MFYFVIFCFLLEVLFLIRNRKGMGPNDRELGGAERKIVIRIYCIRKKSTFNKRENVLESKNIK